MINYKQVPMKNYLILFFYKVNALTVRLFVKSNMFVKHKVVFSLKNIFMVRKKNQVRTRLFLAFEGYFVYTPLTFLFILAIQSNFFKKTHRLTTFFYVLGKLTKLLTQGFKEKKLVNDY